MGHGITTYPHCSLNRWFVPKTMPVDCPFWFVYSVKISARNIETSRHGDENTVKVEVGQCISYHWLFSYFSAKKKDLLCFWAFLVVLTVGYKIIHLPNSENISHLRNTQAYFSWVIIFCFFDWYFADLDQKTTICVKTNNIFGITIKTE
jgi:hypothetical protein